MPFLLVPTCPDVVEESKPGHAVGNVWCKHKDRVLRWCLLRHKLWCSSRRGPGLLAGAEPVVYAVIEAESTN
jgi:hypothetical protein